MGEGRLRCTASIDHLIDRTDGGDWVLGKGRGFLHILIGQKLRSLSAGILNMEGRANGSMVIGVRHRKFYHLAMKFQSTTV